MASGASAAGISRRLIRKLEAALLLLCFLFLGHFVWMTNLLEQHDVHRETSPFSKTSKLSSLFKNHTVSFVNGSEFNQWQQNDTMNNERLTESERKKRWRDNHWNPGQLGKRRRAKAPLKVGLPIFVASLPKSGTTSIWQYFRCGGYAASHQYVKVNDTDSVLSGICIHDNIARNRPPFQNCGDAPIFTDTGFALFRPINDDVPRCYYPSVLALDAIYESYPNATIVLVIRSTASWYESLLQHGNGTLLNRWILCDIPGFPTGNTLTAEEVMNFYDWHNENVRRFARAHPSLHYLEFNLESNRTGQRLKDQLGIPRACWGKCRPTSPFCKKLA